MDRVGNFLLDPFNVALPADGDAANHPGFVHSMEIDPGQTISVLHYVVTGLSEVTAPAPEAPIPAAGSEVARVQTLATELAEAPDVSGLNSAELCSIQNFDLELDSCANPSGAIQGGITETAAPLKLKTSVAYDVVGKTITELNADLASGATTSLEITQAYLDRIAAYDRGPFGLHSVIAIAPDALEQAAAADAARAAGDDRPLLGIPIMAKDIIDVKGLPTTGASLIFEGYMPEEDAWQIAKLREAGAVIFAKTNLAEFANDGHYSPGAYGQVWNAFDPSRSPIGSSGGSAVAVASSFAAAALGTQTGDSLWGPSGAASLFSFRGTDGMQSSAGTMPLTLITDYVGFISQSTEDLALLLDVATVDNPDDVLDDVANGNRPEKWDALFDADALQGKVIGVPVGGLVDPFGTTETSDALKAHFATFEAAGATIVEMPAAPAGGPREYGGDANYEGWAQWIEAHPNNPYTLPEQITRSPLRIPSRINTNTYEGAGRMTEADQRGFEAWRASWREALGQWMDESGVDAVLFATPLSDIHLNDSIIPSFGRIDPQSSGAGVPTAIFPAGSNVNGNPVGLQLQGREFQDAELLAFANAFDQHAKGRVLPSISPALEYDPDAPKQTVSPLPALKQGTPMAAAGYLSGSVSAICENGIPQLSYELNGYGVAVEKEAKLVFESDGKATEVPLGTIVAGEAITGTVNWPGITVVDEEVVSWPDWTLSDGSWVQDPDAEFAWTTGLSSVKVTAGVKLTQEISYPSAEAGCQITPPGAVVVDPVDPSEPVDPATPGDGEPAVDAAKPVMPNTGAEIGAMLPLIALVLLFAGAAALWFVNRRKNKTVDLND